MAILKLDRVDLRVSLRRTPEGGAQVRIEGVGEPVSTTIPAETVRSWIGLPSGGLVPDAPGALGLREPLRRFARRARRATSGDPSHRRYRLTLQINDPELSALAWEASVASALPAGMVPIVIRVSPVRPRVLEVHLTLPLRILQVDPVCGRSLPKYLSAIFGHRKQAEFSKAVQVRRCATAEIRSWRPPFDWPTVEVLHLDQPRFPRRAADLLSTSTPRKAGTLGWLARIADVCQTRLVVLSCTTPREAAAARQLAAALVARGGPAVLVGDVAAEDRAFYYRFYDRLVHDTPLDEALFSALLHPADCRLPSLFAGAGREEALRVSTIGQNLRTFLHDFAAPIAPALRSAGLLRLAQSGASSRARPSPVRRKNMAASVRGTGGDRSNGVFRGLRGSGLGRGTFVSFTGDRSPVLNLHPIHRTLEKEWPDYAWAISESRGLLPLSERLSEVQKRVGVRGPARTRAMEAGTPEPRYLNADLLRDDANGRLIEIDPREDWLRVGESCHLGLQIGPKSGKVLVFGAAALLEEVFKWTPESRGVWVEIGVTGIGFDILGDPVQELWLPRRGPSEEIFFSVVPQRRGVASLRFCLYFRNDLLQSFRLAALTLGENEKEPDRRNRTPRLARALALPRRQVEGLGHAVRLEYSLTDLQQLRPRPARAVSIVANDLDGLPVVTIKGPDLFSATVDADNTVPDRVMEIRQALYEISTPPVPDRAPASWNYGFGNPTSHNAGTDKDLERALCRLAAAGWLLFQQIVPLSDRKRLRALLTPERQILHVAHVLLEKVIPWSVIYDERYDPGRSEDDEGRQITHTACLAALPRPDGSLPATACGEHTDCLLHPAQINKRRQTGPWLCRDTVACPLHFWGFKHILEIPPQQVKDGAAGKALWDRTEAGEKAKLAAGFNDQLPRATDHFKDLKLLAEKLQSPADWTFKSSRRQELLRNLEEQDLDLIYFYCHARGGLADPTIKPPFLEFQDASQTTAEKIDAAALQFDEPWSHHPLVILNGCGTVAFSPDALSPFITTLVRDREAAGVIGTEIPVWEQLASEVALEFLKRFLADKTAGEALLEVRRALLAQRNPLGLIYTLYADATLKLVRRKGKQPTS